MNIIKKLFCKHDYQFIRYKQISPRYKDLIDDNNLVEFEWHCKHCHKVVYQKIPKDIISLFADKWKH